MYPVQPSALAAIGAGSDEALDLIDSALVLAALDAPDADVASAQVHVRQMTADVNALARGTESPRDRATALATVLHGRHGYSGDRDTYDDSANANLLHVISRRKGLPVALAILYLGIAHRLGWDADGLNVPAHFFIRVGDDETHVLQDPFDDGTLLAAEQVPLKLAPLGLDRDQLRPGIFKPLPKRAVLVRLLNNQAARAEAAMDVRRALELHARMTLLAPHFTGLWWERARLERKMGQLAAARTSLANMLETTRDPELARHVRQAMADLARAIN